MGMPKSSNLSLRISGYHIMPRQSFRAALRRLKSESGQKRKWLGLNGMSGLPSEADIASAAGHVGFVP
jgi:hypothetical protein